MNILYIEDNPDDAKLVERYVTTTPHQLVTVATLDDAYQVLSENTVEMILLDIVLNKRQLGYQFASDLRANAFQQPIVAVTALNTPVSIAACQEAGINYVLAKPYSIMELAETIKLFAH